LSWDLQVFTLTGVELVGSLGGVQLEPQAGGVVARRVVRGQPEMAFTVDGPLGVEREDLPEEVAEAAVGVRQLYELSVPSAAPATVQQLATRFARQLTDEARGVVFDPQQGRVIWPRSTQRRRRPAPVTRVTEISLEWFFPDAEAEHAITELFGVLGRWWPEALPRRFGDYEPLQHRFEDEGLDALLVLARRESSVYWTATRPFFGGSVDVQLDPDVRVEKGWQHDPPDGPQVSQMSVNVDGRWLDDDGWRADLIDGFVAAADRISCIYAQAEVTRNWGYSGGHLWADGKTETWYEQAIDRDGTWQGLPRNPVWLAWLGTPYRHLDLGTPAGSGRLFMSAEPASHTDAPPRQQLPVPDQWLVRGKARATGRAPAIPDGL
jgi:hypothetical protein